MNVRVCGLAWELQFVLIVPSQNQTDIQLGGRVWLRENATVNFRGVLLGVVKETLPSTEVFECENMSWIV